MAGEASGLATAVALAGGAGELPGGDGQAELFDDVLADGSLPTRAKSGPQGGRPKGARNRSTEQWRQYLASRYTSPLIGLAEMWSRTPAELAKDLELYKYHEGRLVTDAEGKPLLDTGAAAAMQLRAREAALPYWHQRQPIAIDGAGGARMGVLVMGDLHVSGGERGDALPLAPTEENQRVIDAAPLKSEGDKSESYALQSVSNNPR
jgi:hypothetical protein